MMQLNGHFMSERSVKQLAHFLHAMWFAEASLYPQEDVKKENLLQLTTLELERLFNG